MTALPDDATMRELAASERVCVRPILQRVTDTVTGASAPWSSRVGPPARRSALVCGRCSPAADPAVPRGLAPHRRPTQART